MWHIPLRSKATTDTLGVIARLGQRSGDPLRIVVHEVQHSFLIHAHLPPGEELAEPLCLATKASEVLQPRVDPGRVLVDHAVVMRADRSESGSAANVGIIRELHVHRMCYETTGRCRVDARDIHDATLLKNICKKKSVCESDTRPW